MCVRLFVVIELVFFMLCDNIEPLKEFLMSLILVEQSM